MSDATTTVGDARSDDRSGSAAQWMARTRARDWWHFLVLPLAGTAPLAVDPARVAAAVRGVVVAALVLAFGYLLNGIADRSMDSSARKNPFVAEPVRPIHLLAVGTLAALALVLSLTGPLVVIAATVVALLTGVVYSAGPRLKRRPVVGTLANVACFTPLVFVGIHGPIPPPTPVLAAVFSTLLLENQLLHEGQDAQDDSRGGVRTTYSVLGARGAASAMALVGAVAAACGRELGGDATGVALFGVFAMLFPYLALRTRGRAAELARLRSLHRVTSALAGAGLYVLGFVGLGLAR